MSGLVQFFAHVTWYSQDVLTQSRFLHHNTRSHNITEEYKTAIRTNLYDHRRRFPYHLLPRLSRIQASIAAMDSDAPNL
jgi:hypothetical protein